MKMTKFKLGAIITGVTFILVLAAGFTGIKWIGVGNVGIVKHMNGEVTELGQGIHWVGWGVAVQKYPTYMQSLVLSDNTKEGGTDNQQWSVGTSDQQELPVNTSLTWKINIKNAPALYQTVGGKDIGYISDSIVKPTMKNVVNKITHRYTWNDIKGAGQAEVTEKINVELAAQLEKVGISIGTFGFTHVGSPKGMEQSQQALATAELNVKKAQAEQDKAKIENQTRILNAQTDAEAAKIKAEGEAAANQLLAKSLTPDLVEYNKVQKWNGVNPTTVLGNGANTLVTVK
jgi:regulator of protease activity HflC (stomatin/prohibitin superfamily)